jgi:RNA polymerase sigma-70 factor (ECF subfamily)
MPGVTERTLSRARAGHEDAFRELTDPYRRELQLHVYRIVGSAQDAAPGTEPTRRAEPIWLQPYPDVLLAAIPDEAPGPEARYETKEAIALAFIAGLQHLPPHQRAVLVLRDVLGFRAGEVAEMLETSESSVNSLLRRARAAFETRLPAAGRERTPLPNSKRDRHIIGRLADAFEAGDIDGVVALLTDDAWLTMPPEPYEYQGQAAIGAFLSDRAVRRGAPLRLVPTRANGQPAFGIPDPVDLRWTLADLLSAELCRDRQVGARTRAAKAAGCGVAGRHHRRRGLGGARGGAHISPPAGVGDRQQRSCRDRACLPGW